VISSPRLIETTDRTGRPKAETPHRRVTGLRRNAQTVSHIILTAVTMSTKTLHQNIERARRFALHLPVYFRQAHSATWLVGMTENISCTGMLLRSTHPLIPETSLELRLQLAVGANLNPASEIRCKGAVVRVEQANGFETPVVMAVAIRDYRIVRHVVLKEGPVGISQSPVPPVKASRRKQ
jgi:hypothetical protein